MPGFKLLTLVAMLACAVPAQAGQSRSTGQDGVRVAARSPGEAAPALPVSLERIRRKLRTAQAVFSSHTLRLEFYVEVFGRAPALDVLKDLELTHGPVPYGAPTHAEFLAHVTPEAFRSPPMDLSAPLAWLARRLTGSAK